MIRSSLPALRLRPLSEWRLPNGSSGVSLELLWQGQDGFWRGIYAAGVDYHEAMGKAQLALAEAIAKLGALPAEPA